MLSAALDRLFPGLQVLPSLRVRLGVLARAVWQSVLAGFGRRMSAGTLIILSVVVPLAALAFVLAVNQAPSGTVTQRSWGIAFHVALYFPIIGVVAWDMVRRLRLQVRLDVNALGFPVCHRCGEPIQADHDSECTACGAPALKFQPRAGTAVCDSLREMPELLYFGSEAQAEREFRLVRDALDPPWKYRAVVISVLTIAVLIGGYTVWWKFMPRATRTWVNRTVSIAIVMTACSVTPVYLLLWIRTVRRELRRRLDELGLWPHAVWCLECRCDLRGVAERVCPRCGSRKRRAGWD